MKEELKMFLLLRENGGWGSKQGGCFTDKPVVSMQSAVLYCRDTERWRERERAGASLLICLQPPPSARQTRTQQERPSEESHTSSVVLTINVHGGAGNYQEKQQSGLLRGLL